MKIKENHKLKHIISYPQVISTDNQRDHDLIKTQITIKLLKTMT